MLRYLQGCLFRHLFHLLRRLHRGQWWMRCRLHGLFERVLWVLRVLRLLQLFRLWQFLFRVHSRMRQRVHRLLSGELQQRVLQLHRNLRIFLLSRVWRRVRCRV